MMVFFDTCPTIIPKKIKMHSIIQPKTKSIMQTFLDYTLSIFGSSQEKEPGDTLLTGFENLRLDKVKKLWLIKQFNFLPNDIINIINSKIAFSYFVINGHMSLFRDFGSDIWQLYDKN
jgi:hypothetical protein